MGTDAVPGRNAGSITPAPAAIVIVVMGVAGSGKTTIGQKLAAALRWPFRDADEFHSAANIAKMAAGQPLTDADRAPWLAAIRDYIEHRLAAGESAVVTCSALRATYRQQLRADPARVKFVHLTGDFDLIRRRLEQRAAHFMGANMLDSQFATLEPPRDAVTLNVALPPDEIVAAIRQSLRV